MEAVLRLDYVQQINTIRVQEYIECLIKHAHCLVDILIEEETIEGPKFREILAEYTEVPERKKYESYFTKG